MKTVVVTLLLALVATPAWADFSSHWHDGRAELNGYKLKLSRYGQERDGECVMIYVTEPFSESKRVKVDDARRNPSDTFDALKLNLVRDFRTGIYDYNTMVSVFTRSSNFEPVKVSFTSAEWCGHVYAELIFDKNKVHGKYFSYFEGESGTVLLDRPRNSITEDNLFILLRGLRGDFLQPGESKKLKMLPGVLFVRLSHSSLAYTDVEIARHDHMEQARVPAGDFDVMIYDVKTGDGRDGTFEIEAEYPHRIIKWSLAPDISGELTGSKRLKYWMLNGNGQESYLKDIGLAQ